MAPIVRNGHVLTFRYVIRQAQEKDVGLLLLETKLLSFDYQESFSICDSLVTYIPYLYGSNQDCLWRYLLPQLE